MEDELGYAVDTPTALLWTARPDGYVDFVDKRWCEYTGLSVDRAYGGGWQTVIHAEDLGGLVERWRSILASGELSKMEARVRRFDGEYRRFVFRIRPLVDPSGQIVKWFGVNTDIEGLRRSEEARLAREGYDRSLIEGISSLVSLMTAAGELDICNSQVLEYFGQTLEELKDWTTSNIVVHPDDLPRTLAAWKQALETGEPYDVKIRMRRADGIYRWFTASGLPLKDAQGRVIRWCVLETDIEDRERGEALFAGEKQLLEMVARGRSMPEILEVLCQLVESTAGGCYCSVVLVDPRGKHLQHGAAPSLPPSFIASIIGRPVNVDSGPCAMAACLNEQVIACDLASETRWAAQAWYPMARAHGLQACWSTPISSTAGKIFGALAIYYEEPRTPTPQEQALIHQLTYIASIVIERAQSDAALKYSEARKAAILDSALDCIVTIDHEGCVTEFNPAAERTFGYRRDEVMGKQLDDVFIPPSLRETHRQGLVRYLATGEARMIGRRAEMTAVRADGSEFPIELAISRIPLDGPPSFTGYLRDITERKRAEEELRRSDAYLAEAQKLSMTGSFGWNLSTDKHYWSEETFRIFELDPSIKVTLQSFLDRVHPQDVPLVRQVIALAAKGEDIDYECRLLMPNDFVKHIHIVAHGTKDQYGRIEYIGAVQDVTKRRLSEQALGDARSELAHVARAMSLEALTASIAHEVNQPLAGIITNAGTCLRMLAADPPNVEGARETASRTIRDGKRASEVITRLRALFSKKDATTEPVDLNEATREVIALSSGDLQRARVILRPEFADDLPPVTGDRVQLQQVILNLLRNASDAMSGVEDRPRQLVIRTERQQDDHVRLSVQDAGVGFDPQSADRLFDAFYSTKSDGMGIGLSVSRSIIENHHGSLWATPNDGPGATFSFSIPTGFEGVASARDIGAARPPAVTAAQHFMRSQ